MGGREGRLHLEAGYGEESSRPLPSPRGEGWGARWAPTPLSPGASCRTARQVEVIGGADKYHSVCRLCYFKKPSGQPAVLDSEENKENCPMTLGKPAEAAGVRKLFATHQIRQCSQAN